MFVPPQRGRFRSFSARVRLGKASGNKGEKNLFIRSGVKGWVLQPFNWGIGNEEDS